MLLVLLVVEGNCSFGSNRHAAAEVPDPGKGGFALSWSASNTAISWVFGNPHALKECVETFVIPLANHAN